MRMHTALHVMSAVIKGNVTGGQVSADKSRLDFNLDGEVPTKEWVTEEINKLLALDRPVTPQWVTDEELAARPELVKTMSVRPPMGAGRVRLLADRRRRPAGLRRHACRAHRRDRPGRVHQDREQGQDEPAVHHRPAVTERASGPHHERTEARAPLKEERMDYARPDALVSTDWLAARLDAPDIRLVDGSFYLPAQKRDPKAEFVNQHIPGAVFFDIDEIADTSSPLPHMLPSPEKFSSRVRKLGLGDGNKIVVYDTTPMTGACRVWWMFRAMGHKDVAVLDGGLPKWMSRGPTRSPTIRRRRASGTSRRGSTIRWCARSTT